MIRRSLGIFIDGHILRTALIAKRNDRYEVEMLETFKLYDTLEYTGSFSQAAQGNGKSNDDGSSGDDPFNIDLEVFEEDTEGSAITEAQTNLDVLGELVARMCPRGTSLAFNLIDGNVIYKNLKEIKGKNDKSIKKAIWQEFNEDSGGEANLERVGYVKRKSGGLLALVHDDPLLFASLLYELKRITRKQPPQVKLIDTIEFALAHEIQKSIDMAEDEHSVVVFFSKSFTKIFFMQGGDIEAVLPTIDEGANSETVCETSFSKILFEFDSGNIGPLNRMILVGDYKTANAEKFFKTKLPSLPLQPLECGRAQMGAEVQEKTKDIHNYSIAMALALKALENKPKPPYNLNFIPRTLHNKQSVYKIAWHGLFMLGIVFLCTFLLTVKIIKKNQQIQSVQNEISMLSQEIQRLSGVEIEMDSLAVKIANLEQRTALLDSLSKNTTRWTPILETFSDAYHSIGKFNLIGLSTPKPDQLVANFELTNKDQVAELERFIDKSMVLSVTNTERDEENSLQVQIECNVKKPEQTDYLAP